MTAFTFAIALTPRGNAGDWRLIETLLDLTLASVRAQTDPNWRALIAVHERPRLAVPDDRISFVEVDWPVAPPGPYNDDSGRKKHFLSDLVRDRGGGYLMILDADDWVDRDLVAAARAGIGENHVGALIEAGLVVDFRTRRAAPLPHPELEGLPFHRFCGSCGVVLIRPDADTPIGRDPFAILRSHHLWVEVAEEHGVTLASLPVSGAYLVNTGENHSDLHGPYADWRRDFIARVNTVGSRLDAATSARFGQDFSAA
ncbi:MAG: hypothetical protein ACRYGP_13220 [Janthinobacterium lividum]